MSHPGFDQIIFIMRCFTIFIWSFMFFACQLEMKAQSDGPKHFFTTNLFPKANLSTINAAGLSSNLTNTGLDITDDTNVFSLSIALVYGRFVAKRWLLGSGLTFEMSDSEFFDNDARSTFLTFTPFIRYYLRPVAPAKTRLFVETSFSRFFFFQRPEVNRSNYDAGIGFTHFLHKNLALDGKLSYVRERINTGAMGRLQAGFALNVLLGNNLGKVRGEQMTIQKGSWMTGLNKCVLSATDQEDSRDRVLQLQFKGLYFISNRLALGAGVELEATRARIAVRTSSDPFSAKVMNTLIRFRPQARYYLYKQSQRIMFFTTAGVGIQYARENLDTGTRQLLDIHFPMNDIFVDAGLGLGSNVFLTRNLAFEFGPNIQFGLDRKYMRFGIDTGLVFSFNKAQ